MRYYLLLKGSGDCCDYSPIGGTLACNKRFIKIEAETHEEAVQTATKLVMDVEPQNIDRMFLISVGDVLTPQLKVAVQAALQKDENEEDDGSDDKQDNSGNEEDTDEEA